MVRVILAETPSHSIRLAHAPRQWLGCGEQARFLNSQQPLIQRRRLLHCRPRPLLLPLLFPSRARPVAAVAAAAGTTATMITPRLQHQPQLRRQLQLRPQHLRRPLQATAARRPRVASQTLICRIAISLRRRCLGAIQGTQAIRLRINRKQPILSLMKIRRSLTISPPVERLAQITSRWRQQVWPPHTAHNPSRQ